LPAEQFQAVLPLVRRTFGRFTPPERGQIGQAVASLGGGNVAGRAGGIGRGATGAVESWELDEVRARPAVALAASLLGLGEEKKS
jgi:hypothetical protein